MISRAVYHQKKKYAANDKIKSVHPLVVHGSWPIKCKEALTLWALHTRFDNFKEPSTSKRLNSSTLDFVFGC